MSRLSRRAVLLVGFVIGLGLWLVPALLLGSAVPWDGHGPAYPLALVIVGLLLGFFGPGRPGAAVAGVFLGQVVVLLWQVATRAGSRELWLISVVLLAGYTFVATGIGAFLGNELRRRLSPETRSERRISDRRT
jgi:hypothetical protein